MPNANRSTTVRAKPTGHDQPNRGAACEDGSHAAGPRADAGEQESLLAEWRGLGNNLGERKVESAWPRKGTGRDSVKATDFNVYGVFSRDRSLRERNRLNC